jgi:hypothetical protein
MVRKRAVSVVAFAVLFALLTISCLPVTLLQMGLSAPPTPSPTATRPAPTPTPSPTPYRTPTAVPVPTRVLPSREEREVITPEETHRPEGQRIAETDHFQFYAPDGAFPAAVPDLPEVSEKVYDGVSARLELSTRNRIRVTFRPPSSQPCPPRGLAAPRPARIFIYADDETSRDQILGVLAHELGHILIMDRFRDIPRALNEGLATWASARYFNAWLGYASFDGAVRSYVEDGTYLPLHENYYLTDIYPGEDEGTSEGCIDRRETLYTEWASFLDYLIERHGMGELETLIKSVPDPQMTDGELTVEPADFEGVYGSSLNQLEAAWLRHVLGQGS